jgi:inosine-uridine nucleoside N-ribohydrolase
MFTDVDDVGALAVVNALMSMGEANLVGVVVDTSSQYSAGCAAAVDTYFGHPNVPIGITYPVTTGLPDAYYDYISPCSQFPKYLDYANIPPALSVYRRTLAAQPNGSVVIVAIGFEGGLEDLLKSSGDGYSSLNGQELVAQKVKMLVAMGGGYTAYPGEHNFAANPGAAAYVADTWPTKVVYSGYEVGEYVTTGQTLSSTTPPTNPVRAAYEAFTHGPRNWDYSWDLTAAYHAIRPLDPVMTESGPGTNTIDPDTGSNTWTPSTGGNRYYLVPHGPLDRDTGYVAINNAIEPLLAYNLVNIGVQPGWNLVSLPLSPTVPLFASALLTTLLNQTQGQYAEVAGFEGGQWTSSVYIDRKDGLASAGDFTLQFGHSYALYSDKAGGITFTGTMAAAPPLSVSPGWNLVGFPVSADDAPKAYDILATLPDQTRTRYAEIDGYAHGQWSPSVFDDPVGSTGLGGTNFTMQPGQSYALFTDKGSP